MCNSYDLHVIARIRDLLLEAADGQELPVGRGPYRCGERFTQGGRGARADLAFRRSCGGAEGNRSPRAL